MAHCSMDHSFAIITRLVDPNDAFLPTLLEFFPPLSF